MSLRLRERKDWAVMYGYRAVFFVSHSQLRRTPCEQVCQSFSWMVRGVLLRWKTGSGLDFSTLAR